MKISVFTKIFAYTMLLLLLMSLATALLFARQFLAFYREEQQRQLSASFQPIIAVIADRDRTMEEIMEAARSFTNSNQSFNFVIQERDGKVIFATQNYNELPFDNAGQSIRLRFMGMSRNQNPGLEGEGSETGYIFTGYGLAISTIQYSDLLRRSFLALGIMLAIAIFGAVLFAKKVTKPLEDEIIREREREESQRLFFSAASHELKTPIAAARALVEGMIAGVGDYKDHGKYLRQCLHTLDSQAHLVSEILEIVKLREDADPLMVSLDIRELGNIVLAEYRPLAEQRGLTVQAEIPGVFVKADRNLLQRVLSNVIANAVQNTPEGGLIRIEADMQKSLRLTILNTGAYISEELIHQLFEPFYRVDAARTRQSEQQPLLTSGTQSGLGLAIVKKALDRMSVPFSLENTPEGVLFRMDLELYDEFSAKKNFRKTSANIHL